MTALDWSDLQLCLRIAREGSVKKAAERYGVSHSTLLRRLGHFERVLGAVVFLRTASGCTPTPVGHAVLEAAEAMEAHARMAMIQGGQAAGRASGPLRVALPDLSGRFLMPAVARFADAHPEIILTLVGAQTPTQLTSGEVDVMLALADAPPVGQMGRRLGHARFAVYRSAACNRTKKVLVELRSGPEKVPVSRFIAKVRHAYDRSVVVGDLSMLLDAVRAGLGDGVLPCVVGDRFPDLARLADTIMSDPGQAVWVLYRRELKNSPRVGAFVSFISEELKKVRAQNDTF